MEIFQNNLKVLISILHFIIKNYMEMLKPNKKHPYRGNI